MQIRFCESSAHSSWRTSLYDIR